LPHIDTTALHEDLNESHNSISYRLPSYLPFALEPLAQLNVFLIQWTYPGVISLSRRSRHGDRIVSAKGLQDQRAQAANIKVRANR
jgi:hypothetical protein